MTVTINDKLNTDLGLDFIHKEIAPAEPKLYKVSVPLSDGDIDVTDTVSSVVRYNNREIQIVFEIRKERREWAALMSELNRLWNGKTVRVTFSDDPSFYWRGRAVVGALEDHGYTAGVTVTVDAEPFKRTLAREVTVFNVGSTSSTFNLHCSHTIGIPYFVLENTGTASLVCGQISGTIYNTALIKRDRVYGLELRYGDTDIRLQSDSRNPTIKVEIEGGEL